MLQNTAELVGKRNMKKNEDDEREIDAGEVARRTRKCCCCFGVCLVECGQVL